MGKFLQAESLYSTAYITCKQGFLSYNYSIFKYLPSTIFLIEELVWLHFYITFIHSNKPIASRWSDFKE